MSESGNVVMKLLSIDTQRISFLSPALEDNQSLALGIGSLREVFQPDCEQRPVLRQVIGLVLVGDTRVVDVGPCVILLSRITAYLEAPFRLLLSV